MKKSYKVLVPICAAAVIGSIVLCASITHVPVGETGIVKRFGAVTEETLSEGFHFKAPFIESVYDMDNKIQKAEIKCEAVSRDMQVVTTTVAVNFYVPSNQSAAVYQDIGKDYEDVVLVPCVQESIKAIMAKYSASELVSSRTLVASGVQNLLSEKVESYGIFINQSNITDMNFSEEYNAAIEAKQVAEQQKEQAEIEAEKTVISANASADKKRIDAQAEADAIKIKADAKAAANKEIAASISSELTEYNKIEKWNGELPQVSGTDGTIIDFGSLQNSKTDSEE